MKTTRLIFTSFVFVGLVAASQPMLAAAPKTDARAAALVAALQAVSPDPLGGRLGLTISAAQQPAVTKEAGRNATTPSPRAQIDQLAYASWKSGR